MSTDTPTVTLTDFLLARIGEDEAVARAAEHSDGPETFHWELAGGRHHRFDNGLGEDYYAVRCGTWDRILVARDEVGGVPLSRHIARHDPARVLADCEARRRIVSMCSPTLGDELRAALSGDWDEAAWLARNILAALALPYADHPDYNPDWRP